MADGFIWRPSAELVERANVTRLERALGAADYHELHRISVEEPERFWPAVVEDLGIEFSRPWDAVVDASRGPEWATWFVGGRLNVARVCVHRWAGERPDEEALVWQERGRASRVADLGRGVAPGDAARRGARRARRARGRPRRDLHADVPRGRRRVACVRARRGRAGADLLRLRRPRDRVAARGLAGEGRALRGLVAAARQARRDARDARRGGPLRRGARRRVEPDDRRVAGGRDEAAGHARAGRGRLGGALSARLHLGHHGQAEGSAARAGRLPRVDRPRGRVPDRREGRRPPPLRHRHGLDHGPVDGGGRRRRRRDDRVRRGRARLARRPAVEPDRVGARDDARPLAHARARAHPEGRAGGRPLVAAGDLHDGRAVEPGSVPLALRPRGRRRARRS